MRILSIIIISIAASFIHFHCFAQIKKTKTFIYDGNGMEHIALTLRSDGTFKYLMTYDQIFDMGCGNYKMKMDTVLFEYQFDENDDCCNTEKHEIIWGKGDLIENRPSRLYLVGSKLYKIEDGKVYFKAKFPLRTNENAVVLQDNYYLIDKKYAKKSTWH